VSDYGTIPCALCGVDGCVGNCRAATIKAIVYECCGTEVMIPVGQVGIGEACGPHLTVEHCPVCRQWHEFHSPQFGEYLG
jgi:hypothetical protein